MPNLPSFKLDGLNLGSGLFLIAGPCVIESEAHALKMAEEISAVARKLKFPTFSKRRMTKPTARRCIAFADRGWKRACASWKEIGKEAGVPVLTDVHEAKDVPAVAEAVDVVQIPAFLCRQTDMLVAAAKHAKSINIKKGQFVSPWDMRHAVEKVRASGNDNIVLTERGSSFGYNNLVVDMRSLAIMRQFAPVVFDATHSIQLPSSGVGRQSRFRRTAGVYSAIGPRGRGSRRGRRVHGSA